MQAKTHLSTERMFQENKKDCLQEWIMGTVLTLASIGAAIYTQDYVAAGVPAALFGMATVCKAQDYLSCGKSHQKNTPV
jgi:hypothetical protein